MKKYFLAAFIFLSCRAFTQPITDGLVGYFTFSGNAVDESVNENDGSVVGAVLTTDRSGNSNSAYYFDGSGDRIVVGTDGLDVTQGTIAMWVRPSELASLNKVWEFYDTWSTEGSETNERIIFWKGSGGASGTNLVVGIDSYNDFQYDISNWEIGIWHHIAMTWRAKNDGLDYIILYVDGAKAYEKLNMSKNITSKASTANIGARFSTNSYVFFGAIDDVMIFNRPLDLSEIQTLHGVDTPPSISKGWELGVDKVFVMTESVGIGTEMIPAEYKLAIDGKAIMEGIKVQIQEQWPDYVFEENYPLRSLEEVEGFVLQNKHLPGIPNATTVQKHGIDLAEMNALLLQKIEELTLYMIEQEKKMQKLERTIEEMASKMK